MITDQKHRKATELDWPRKQASVVNDPRGTYIIGKSTSKNVQ